MKFMQYHQPARRLTPATALSRHPFGSFESDLNRLLGPIWGEFHGNGHHDRFRVELHDGETQSTVRAELPGFDRKQIEVEVEKGQLSLKARRAEKAEDHVDKVEFNRTVELPDSVNAEAIAAAYENGVLTVTLPKKAAAKPRQIKVA